MDSFVPFSQLPTEQPLTSRPLPPSALLALEYLEKSTQPNVGNSSGQQSQVVPFSPQTRCPPFPTIRALSAAPFVTTYTSNASFLACAEEFFEDNPLIAATLKPSTQVRYALALENFKASHVANERTQLSLDQRLSIYIQERYTINARPGQSQEMANLLCMITLMYPCIKLELCLARRCISGWKTLKPARSSAPFTKQMVLALAWSLITRQKLDAETVLLTCFSACLRVSEALKLTWNRVALPGDLRLAAYRAGTAGVNIHDAKTSMYTGKLQFVKLTDPEGIKFIIALHRSRYNPSQRLAPISYQQYFEALQQAVTQFNLSETPFTSHSARIGKATEDFIRGEPVKQIAINGRWKSLNSLRYYLNNGRAWILKTPISSTQQQQLEQAADRMKQSLQS